MEILDFENMVSQLPSEDVFEQFQLESEDRMQGSSDDEKKEWVNYLSGILSGKNPIFHEGLKSKQDELQTFWVSLAFAAFMSYQTADRDNLLQRRILYAIQKGFNPDNLLDQIYSYYESEEHIQELCRQYAHDLEENTETFGSTPITVEGRRMLPQLKYWILDYAKFPSKVAKRGAVERLNYVDNSPNTKALTQGQRDVLLAVLKLYDEFNNPTIPQRSGDDLYEYELADNYAEASREQIPAAQPVPVTQAQPTFTQVVQNPDEELIVHKLEDLRERTNKDGMKQ